VIVLSTQTPSEGELIRAIREAPATNWAVTTLTYPNGLAGVPLLSHAMLFGMTNAVDLLVSNWSGYSLEAGSMYDPIGAAIGSGNWGILDRLLSSEVGRRLDGCDCCHHLERIPLDAEQVPRIEHLERLVLGCSECPQKGRLNDLLLPAMVRTNAPLSKLLMRAGARPQYSIWYQRVVAVGNAVLERQLASELESRAFLQLSSTGAVITVGGEAVVMAGNALQQHDWRTTIESAAEQSGFRAVLVEVHDAAGERLLGSAVDPAAVEVGVNLFLRNRAD
jgi:hypothetical protein